MEDRSNIIKEAIEYRKQLEQENAQKLIKDYYEKIAMPLFKLQEDD